MADSLDNLLITVDGLSAQARNLNYSVPLRAIMVLLNSETKQNFQRQASPDGVPWAPLKRPRARKRDKKAKGGKQRILRDTGLLMAAASAASASGAIREIGTTHLVHGVNVDYGVFHQEGTRKMVARPFHGITDTIAEKAANMVATYVARRLGG